VTKATDIPRTAPAFRNAYRSALERHLTTPGEATLQEAYELGRTLIELELTMLDLADAHHTALATSLHSPPADSLTVLAPAADFLAEALTASEMLRRGYFELREAERLQRERAALVRSLSSLLADTSLATPGSDAITEMIRLVAEHARELTHAEACAVRLDTDQWHTLEARSVDDDRVLSKNPDVMIALRSLDGSPLGAIDLWQAESAEFSELDKALAHHVAQMASAALERAQMHARASSKSGQ
jgi:hypothetical protein